MANVIRRGQIWVVNLDPSFGREIHKKRPAIVISNDDINQSTPFVVIVPSSSIVPKALSPDLIHLGKLPGFDKDSILIPMFIRHIDKNRLVKKIGTLPKVKLLQLESSLRLVVGLKI